MAQSSSGGTVICYILPVLRMTSRLAVMGRMRMRGTLPNTTSGVVTLGWTVMSVNALFAPVTLTLIHELDLDTMHTYLHPQT